MPIIRKGDTVKVSECGDIGIVHDIDLDMGLVKVILNNEPHVLSVFKTRDIDVLDINE